MVAAHGCVADVTIRGGYPVTISHDDTTWFVRSQAVRFLGVASVLFYPQLMTAKDFGSFSQQYPCCFYRFAVAGGAASCGKLHFSRFLIDEGSLFTATGLMAYISVEWPDL